MSSLSVRAAYLLQYLRHPLSGAGQLVAAVARGRGREEGLRAPGDADSAPGGEREHAVTLHGLNNGQCVPHLLACIAVARHIDLLDGVYVSPRDIADDLLGGYIQWGHPPRRARIPCPRPAARGGRNPVQT